MTTPDKHHPTPGTTQQESQGSSEAATAFGIASICLSGTSYLVWLDAGSSESVIGIVVLSALAALGALVCAIFAIRRSRSRFQIPAAICLGFSLIAIVWVAFATLLAVAIEEI